MSTLNIISVLLLVLCVAATWLIISPWQRSYVTTGQGLTVKHLGLLQAGPQSALTFLAGLLALGWGVFTNQQLTAAASLPVLTVLFAAASVDVVCHRLPNRLLAWAAAFAVLSTLVSVGSSQQWGLLLTAIGATSLVGAVTLGLSLVGSGMGFGDVKLMLVVGLWLGYLGLTVPLLALAAGFMLAGPVAILRMLFGRLKGKDTMAFGPYLVAGACLIWGLLV